MIPLSDLERLAKASVPMTRSEAKYYAAASPDVILALCARLRRLICPYGDATCPCRDGDACHYEGANPMVPPQEALVARVRELEDALQNVMETDRTPPYAYHGPASHNRHGVASAPGQRWATPTEIAQKALTPPSEPPHV